MIYTFISHRILNPMLVKKFQEISIFTQNINIYSDSIKAKLAFVVTKWWQDVTWKLWCFLAPEIDDLRTLSNSLGTFWQSEEITENIDSDVLTSLGTLTPVTASLSLLLWHRKTSKSLTQPSYMCYNWNHTCDFVFWR